MTKEQEELLVQSIAKIADRLGKDPLPGGLTPGVTEFIGITLRDAVGSNLGEIATAINNYSAETTDMSAVHNVSHALEHIARAIGDLADAVRDHGKEP